MKKLKLILLLFFAFSNKANSELLLFGGNDHDDFLGCYNCSKYNSDSICNKYGIYGSKYSSDSIWNEYGNFGSKYSSSSPWNKYSSGNDVPVIVDRSGKFFGYFTINCYRGNAFNSCARLKDAFERSRDLNELRNNFCE